MKTGAGLTFATIITAFSKGLPDPLLLVLVAICMVVDLITGIFHAKARKEQITSYGYRRTIAKFIQYGGALMIGIMLTTMADRTELKGLESLMPYLSDGMAIFIIYIELISILENLEGIDKKSQISKVFRALRYVLTFEITKLTKNAEVE